MPEDTPIKELERLAGLASRRAEAMRESMDDYRAEVIEKLNEAQEYLKQVDINALSEQVGMVRDAAEELKELGLADEEMVAELDTSAGWFGTLADRFNFDLVEAVLERFDTFEQALDAYDDLKDSDSYPGKKDDVEAAWEEVTEAVAELGGAHTDLFAEVEDNG